MKQMIRLTEGDLHRIVKESVNKILKESDDYVKDQWDYELKMFMNAIRKGNFEDFGNQTIGVPYKGDESGTRYIVFTYGANTLTDDGFSMSTSPSLSKRHLKEILAAMINQGIIEEHDVMVDYGLTF